MAYRFRISLVAGFRPLFGLVTHHLVVAHLLRVSSLDVLTGVIVCLFIIACVQLLQELLLLLKLYLMLLDDRSLRIVFNPLDQGKGLLFLHVIDHLQLLRRVHASDLLESIG